MNQLRVFIPKETEQGFFSNPKLNYPEEPNALFLGVSMTHGRYSCGYFLRDGSGFAETMLLERIKFQVSECKR